MKKFKTGFTAIIGALAIGFTIAAEAGAFKTDKLIPPSAGCWRRVTILCPGSSVPQLLVPDIPCPPPPICSCNRVTDVVLKVLIPTPIGNCPPAPIVCCYTVSPSSCVSGNGLSVTGFVCGTYTPARK